MMNAGTAPLDKLRIAACHTEAALQMILIGCNPVSVHLPIMAGREILLTIAKARGVELRMDLRRFIKDERRQEWDRAAKRLYNFFKHADRDVDQSLPDWDMVMIYERNDLEVFTNIVHLQDLRYEARREFWEFAVAIGIVYRSLIDWNGLLADFPGLRESYDRLGSVTREKAFTALRQSWWKAKLLPMVPGG